jgi:hypothetical protein
MNQQDNLEDDKQTESLADLELTGEQADEARAGAGSHGSGAGKVAFQDLHITTS